MNHRKTKSLRSLPFKPRPSHKLSPQFEKVAKDSCFLPSLSNKDRNPQHNRTQTKSIFQTEIPTLLENSQSLSLAWSSKIQDHESRQKYEKFCEKLNFLKTLKIKIVEVGEQVLNNLMIRQIHYLNRGEILLQIWKDLKQFPKNMEVSNFAYIKTFQKQNQITIDDEVLRGMDLIGNICKFKLAEFKRDKWKKKEKQLERSEQKLRNNLSVVRQRLIKIPDAETRRQIAGSMLMMEEKTSSSNKKHYQDWKTKALNTLSRNGNIHCQILKAQVFVELFTA